MAHKGKATSDVSFNLEDPPEAYTNPSVHSRISEYTEVARSLHGADHDPSTQDFDGEAVMRAGQGKKHGWFWLGDGVIDTASTPSVGVLTPIPLRLSLGWLGSIGFGPPERPRAAQLT